MARPACPPPTITVLILCDIFLASLNVNPIQQNECQSACAHDDPKSELLKKWTKAYALQRFPIEPGSNEKQRDRQSTFAELVEGTEGVIPCGQHRIQQSG